MPSSHSPQREIYVGPNQSEKRAGIASASRALANHRSMRRNSPTPIEATGGNQVRTRASGYRYSIVDKTCRGNTRGRQSSSPETITAILGGVALLASYLPPAVQPGSIP